MLSVLFYSVLRTPIMFITLGLCYNTAEEILHLILDLDWDGKRIVRNPQRG